MLKIEKEYLEEFGDIPITPQGRMDYILKRVNLSRAKSSVFERIKMIQSIKWKSLEYTIYLLPKATPRPRSGNGIFYVKGAKDNKKIFEKYFKERDDLSLIHTPCKFFCNTYYPIPSSMNSVDKIISELGFIRPISKPDWDNVAKAYCDMIQGTLLYDDSLIIEGISKKFYSIKPRIEIRIEYMEEFDSDFNKNKILKKVR